MNNIIEHEHNGQRWLFVEVPNDAYDIELFCHHSVWYKSKRLSRRIGDDIIPITHDLESGGWEWVGKLSDITEEQARELVTREKRFLGVWPVFGYKDFTDSESLLYLPTEAVESLIRSKGGDANKRYVVLKEVK